MNTQEFKEKLSYRQLDGVLLDLYEDESVMKAPLISLNHYMAKVILKFIRQRDAVKSAVTIPIISMVVF